MRRVAPQAITMLLQEPGDCIVLPGKLAGQGVDFRLALGRQGCKVRPVAFEKRTGVWRSAPAIGCLARLELRYQRRHAPDDLTIDHVQLTLCLPASFLHAEELGLAIFRGHHAAPARQVAKLDGPV